MPPYATSDNPPAVVTEAADGTLTVTIGADAEITVNFTDSEDYLTITDRSGN